MMNDQPIKPGIWRHYKGGFYEVLFCATHTETSDTMVVYRALYGKRKCFVRPVSMWEDAIPPQSEAPFETDGVRRFKWICEMKCCLTCRWVGRGEELNDYGHCWKHNGEADFEQPALEEGCAEWESDLNEQADT